MSNSQTISTTASINPETDSLGINNFASEKTPFTKSTPRIVRAQEAMIFEIPGEKASMLLGSEATGNRLITGTMEVAPHAGPPPHVHLYEDEIFIVRSGEVEFFLNGHYVLANAGDVVFAVRGEVHSFRGMPHSEPNIMTGLVAPAGFERFFAGRAALLASNSATPEKLAAMATEFGITFFAPDAELPIVESPKSRVVRAGTAPVLEAFGDHAEVILSSMQTAGDYTLIHNQTPAKGGPPLHIHDREDELFLIEESTYEFTFETGENTSDGKRDLKTVLAHPGDVVWAPRQMAHTFRNVGDTAGRMYIAAINGQFDLFFGACAAAFENNTATPENLVAIGLEYGIEYLI